MSEWDMPPVVIDNGSYLQKAGFACDNHPLTIFRTVVGRPKALGDGDGQGQIYDLSIGDDAVENSDEYNLDLPVVNGSIVQWDNMERIWHRILYQELRVAPEDRSVFLTCSPRASMTEKIKCCELLLETLNVPAVCIEPSAALAMFSHGQSTGITIDIGYDTTQITPVYEGACIKYANIATGYAGRQAYEYLKSSLDERGVILGKNPSQAVDTVMMKHLYVTENASMERVGYRKYVDLPSGFSEISQEAFMAAEMFFQPELVMPHCGYTSIQHTVLKSFYRCDLDLRHEFTKNVVVSGGLALIPGLGKRLELELSALLDKPIMVSISDEAYVSSWMGGAIFAGIPEAYCLWVTKKQYEDYGEKIVRKKFIP